MNASLYYRLIKAYLQGRMTTDEFGRTFQQNYLAEPDLLDEDLYHILNRVHVDWEVYYPECALEEETPFMISEHTFRQTVKETENALRRYLLDRGVSLTEE